VLVGPMQPSELRRAVELPAGRAGLRVEPELADALVDDVEGQPGALPLLSTALLELWQARDGNTLTLAAYRESGGVHGAVARLAEGTYARIPDEQKSLVRSLLLRLVGEGEGDAAVRRRAPLAELDLERNEPAGRVVATLADSRLVTVSEGSVEVAHEALLREWPRLREWIEEDGQGRRLRRHVTSAARGWHDAGRDDGELYRGARLAAALDWSTEHALELNELEREFVTESREASEREARGARRTNRRLRALLIGIALLLAAAVAGGVLALVQRGDARDAETAQLAQRLGAQALVEDDLDLSLLLARQAVALDDSPQTRGYLLKTLQRSPKAIGIMHAATSNDVLREIAISPDGKTLAVGSMLGFPFFDARTHRPTGPPVKTNWAGTPAYSPDGNTLAYAVDERIRLIDTGTSEQLAEAKVGPPRIAQGLAFTRDGSVLVAVIIDVTTGVHSIGFRDAHTLKPVAASIRPEGFAGAYVGSQFRAPVFVLTPDRRSLVTPSDRGKLLWWDLRTRRVTRTVEIPSGYHALALSPDGLTAAIGIERGIQLVDVRTGGARRAMGGPAQSPNYVLFSPDGKTVVSTNIDGSVILWDVASLAPRETLRGHSASVRQAVFSADGRTLYTVSHDGSAIAWDVAGARGLGRPFTFTHDRAFDQVYDRHPSRFSPDGRLIAVGVKQRGVALWDAARLARVGPPLLETGGEVKAIDFSRDGRALAAVTSNGKASVWDLGTRSLRWGPKVVDRDAVLGVSFSADGTMLATSAETGVRLWNTRTGTPMGRIAKGTIGDVAFSPTAPVVAFVREGWDASTERVGEGGGTVEIWDVRGRSRIAKLEIEPGLILGYGLGFSSDGHLLASGGFGDPLIHLWDVESGKLVRELEQNVGDVMALEFSPDDKTLAIAGAEGLASLWDVASGAQIGPSLTAGSRRAMVDFSPDSRRLLVTTGDGQGAVWDVDPSSWAARACVLANRTMTREEWREFLPGRAYEPACTT
jgi:WD40 repeat protein